MLAVELQRQKRSINKMPVSPLPEFCVNDLLLPNKSEIPYHFFE